MSGWALAVGDAVGVAGAVAARAGGVAVGWPSASGSGVGVAVGVGVGVGGGWRWASACAWACWWGLGVRAPGTAPPWRLVRGAVLAPLGTPGPSWLYPATPPETKVIPLTPRGAGLLVDARSSQAKLEG